MEERIVPGEEYASRIQRVRKLMAGCGFDALLVATGPNLYYLTGYPCGRSVSRPFVLVLPQSGEPVFIVHTGREIEAQRISWVRDVRTYHRLSHAPTEAIKQTFLDRGIDAGSRIGVELGHEMYMDLLVADFLTLKTRLRGVRFEDAGPMLWKARFVKSAWEVENIRQACRTTAKAYEETFPQVREGMMEGDVAQLMLGGMMKRGGGTPALTITSGEGNYDLASRGPWPRRLVRGDMVWMDAFCTVKGYWSDFSRAGVIGGASQKQADMQKRLHEITMLGVGMVKPDVPVRDIAACCNAQLRKLGFPVTSCISDLASRIGHGQGLVTTEQPSVAEDDEAVLEPGMVITMEPSVATIYGIFHVEENVLVTNTGHEVLTECQRELWRLG
jgi:Xaa-Pro aminopeptidase